MKQTCPEQCRRIDPHVHCRDGLEVNKSNIGFVSEMAKEQGIVHICDMPNTNPPILREKDVIERLKLARKRNPATGYSVYVKLSVEEAQIIEAVRLAREYHEVVGLKLYPPENENKKIFEVLAREHYGGVLAVHAEKASLFKPELFDPNNPWTHNLAQPEKAEIESVKEQIRFASETNFAGILYFCHITLPESAEIIWRAKKRLNAYSEITPHHLLFSELKIYGRVGGLVLKVNPPIRSRKSVLGLLQSLKHGLIDCIATDYAPHSDPINVLVGKLNPPYPSGIASYRLYSIALDYLREQGLSEEDIDDLTYWNIKKIFGDKLKDV